jgi:hypothetical protein
LTVLLFLIKNIYENPILLNLWTILLKTMCYYYDY